MPGDQGEYAAVGRSGQYIRVFPALDAIVVTTGGGFEWDEITPLIASAIGDLENPLPANPEGLARLNATLAQIQKTPDPQPFAPLPHTALWISGNTYAFESNPLNLKTMRFEFDDSAETRLHLTFTNQPDQDLKVGLDGIYRLHPIDDYGLSMGLRGSWIDDQTFLLEYVSVTSDR